MAIARNLGSDDLLTLEIARSVLIRPVPQHTAVDAVVDRLRTAIELGVLAPGERLPAETDLSRMLDVGVMTLRAALAQVREEGLVETRRGRTGGSFVRLGVIPRSRGAVDPDVALAVLEVRTAIEAETARLAASRATPREVFRLEVLVEWLGDPARSDRRSMLDAQLHIAIAEASRNERLVEIVIEQRAADMAAFAGVDVWGEDGTWNDLHRKVVDAIGRRDGEAAAAAMRAHVMDVAARYARAVGHALPGAVD